MVASWRAGVPMTWLLCLLQLHHARSQVAANNTTELYIVFITSFGGQYVSSGTVPAVEIALEEINNRADVLPNYKLNLFVGDSQCDRTQSLDTFFHMITTWPPKLAVLGCGCSAATQPVAEIIHHWNITQLSYASASSSLSDRTRFPNFWRTYPSNDNLAQSIVAVVMHYGWMQLKIITQDESLFTSTTQLIEHDLRNAGIFVDMNGTTLFQSGENVATKELLFTPEIRVYFLNMYAQHARRVMCAAVKGEEDPTRYYHGYIWITLGWYHKQWWMAEVAQDNEVNCTDDELERLLERTIAIQQFPTADNTSAPTNVSLTAEEFLKLYRQRLNSSEYSFEHTAYHSYDALWTLAFAVNLALSPLQDLGLSLDYFNYQTTARNISQEIQAQLNDTRFRFMGVSGLVEFNENGTRLPTNPRILKYRNNSVINNCGERGPTSIEPVEVGYVSLNGSQFIYGYCEDDNTTWMGGIPLDGTPFQTFRQINQILFITYTILASAGILFAILCLLFIIIFRNRKLIRFMDPNFYYLMVIGATLLYTTVYFYVIPTTVEPNQTIYCHIRAWTQLTGYSLCFGTIMAMAYIFYRLLYRKKSETKCLQGFGCASHHTTSPSPWRYLNKAVIRKCRPVRLVLVLVAMSTLILICMEATDMYVAHPITDQESPTTRNTDQVLVEYYVLVCYGRSSHIWMISAFAYVLLTQFVSLFLVYPITKTEMEGVSNYYKTIALIIYITPVVTTGILIGAVTLNDFINAATAVFSGLLMVFATVVLGFTFIPKMVEIYREVNGTHVRNTEMSRATDTATAPDTATATDTATAPDTATATATATISTLKAQIKELTAEIAQIRRDSEEQVRTLTAQIAQTRKEQEDKNDL